MAELMFTRSVLNKCDVNLQRGVEIFMIINCVAGHWKTRLSVGKPQVLYKRYQGLIQVDSNGLQALTYVDNDSSNMIVKHADKWLFRNVNELFQVECHQSTFVLFVWLSNIYVSTYQENSKKIKHVITWYLSCTYAYAYYGTYAYIFNACPYTNEWVSRAIA